MNNVNIEPDAHVGKFMEYYEFYIDANNVEISMTEAVKWCILNKEKVCNPMNIDGSNINKIAYNILKEKNNSDSVILESAKLIVYPCGIKLRFGELSQLPYLFTITDLEISYSNRSNLLSQNLFFNGFEIINEYRLSKMYGKVNETVMKCMSDEKFLDFLKCKCGYNDIIPDLTKYLGGVANE